MSLAEQIDLELEERNQFVARLVKLKEQLIIVLQLVTVRIWNDELLKFSWEWH